MSDESRRLRTQYLPVAALVGLLLVGFALLLGRREGLSVTASAHSQDGEPLAVECRPVQDSDGRGGKAWKVTVRNTACRTLTARAYAQDARGRGAISNVVTTKVGHTAKDVCLHVRVSGGKFVAKPESSTGSKVRHVSAGNELVVLLGDMAFGEERALSVCVARGK